MGKIRGDVESVGIANLLQMLSVGGCEGLLTIYRNLQRKVLQFGPAGMRLVSSGSRQSNPLGEILVRGGKLTRPQLEELLEEQRRTGAHLGVLAIRRGFVFKEEVERALQEHIAEEIFDLFSWTGATFEFTGTHGEAPPPGETPLSEMTLDADVMSVILQASRLADELGRIRELIPDVQMVPVRLAEIPVASDDLRLAPGTLQAVLPLIDGQRPVSQIIEESGYPKYRVLGTLYEMVQRGALEIRDSRGGTTVRRRRSLAVPPALPPDHSILVLGDAAESRRPLAAMLRGAGFTVVEGPDSGDLAAIVGQQRIDAIVLDASVETDEGSGLCDRLRSATSIPFITFARGAGREAVVRAAGSGARYVLLKPAKEELLLERIAELVKG